MAASHPSSLPGPSVGPASSSNPQPNAGSTHHATTEAEPNVATNTNSNPSRRFYIPTASSYASPTLHSSNSRSSLAIDIDSLYRLHSSGSGSSNLLGAGSDGERRYRRGRGQSLVALTAALQAYRVPPPAGNSPVVGGGATLGTGTASLPTLSADAVAAEAGPSTLPSTPPPHSVSRPSTLEPPFTPPRPGAWSMTHTQSGEGMEMGMEIMDALVDIHRVLYGGNEDRIRSASGSAYGDVKIADEDKREGWDTEVRELERVVSRWFEGDAIYDHPMLRLPSRSSLLNHFVLVHLLGSGSVPAPTPGNAIAVARGMIHSLTDRVYDAMALRTGIGRVGHGKIGEAGLSGEKGKADRKGKGREIVLRPLDVKPGNKEAVKHVKEENLQVGRWKLWQVGAECTEIGGMECYDGYHLGLIEHVITLNLFPSLIIPHTHTHPRQSLSTRSSTSTLSALGTTSGTTDSDPRLALIPTSAAPVRAARSFSARLASAVGREFGGFLTWELPVSTLVQFKEVGKVTHIRDSIDIQDFIETFVPFAKRLNWLTRRISGLVSSSIGGAVLGAVLPRVIKERIGGVGEMIPVPAGADIKRREDFGVDAVAERFGVDVAPPSASRQSSNAVSPDIEPGSGLDMDVDEGGIGGTGMRGLGIHSSVTQRGSAARGNSLGLEGMVLQDRMVGSGMAPDMDEPGY